MALETGTYISDLVATNPPGTDDRSTADDHIRLIKSTLQNTFPNINGAMNASEEELNYNVGLLELVQPRLDKVDFCDICGGSAGVPPDNLIMLNFVTSRDYRLPQDLTGSYVKAQVACTVAVALTLKKNGTTIGTVNVLAGQTNGTFVFAADVDFVAGDVLTLHNQATADETYADIGYNFQGILLPAPVEPA